MEPIVFLVAAVAENGVIGVDDSLPWRLPDDLKHFRRLTTGHHVIMGRRTCESLGKNLPARVNTVITRNPSFPAPGSAREDKETFVIGGADLYAQMLPRAQKLYLTLVHAPVRGDVRFPTLNWDEWCEVERTRHCADSRHAYAFSFVTLERKN